MNDISEKPISLRTARAEAFLYCTPATLDRVRAGDLPKGNFFDTARAAGLLAAKQTQHLLPHCHPVPIDGFRLDFEIEAAAKTETPTATSQARTGVRILGEGRSVSRTGIEMEVLTAVSVAALTMYDMLKPVDKNLEIGGIRLLTKSGGRSQQVAERPAGLSAAVLITSDRVSRGEAVDGSGPVIAELLAAQGVEVTESRVVPDDAESIRAVLAGWIAAAVPFVFTSGGTGLGPRDVTADVVRSLLEKEVPGIAEAMRRFGQDRTAFAMLSRSVAGSAGGTLLVTLPGSPRAVRECLNAILPGVLHARAMLGGEGHGK